MKLSRLVSRRNIIKTTLAIPATLALSNILASRAIAADQLVFVGFGGSLQEKQEEIFLRTFETQTGNKVISATNPSIAKIKAMVDTGNVEWDVMEIPGTWAASLEKEGYLEPLPTGLVDRSDLVNPKWLRSASVGWYYYSGGIAYDPARHPDGKHPRNWTEFFDVHGFPGRRGLRPRPDENLEIALMADGVAPKDVYPIDVDRAFKSLDRIKPHVKVWIDATAQTITLIQNNEIDFDLTYSGRVEIAKKEGSSIDFVYESVIASPGFLAVPKGSKHKDAAFELIKHIMSPDRQLAWGEALVGYAPQSRAAMSRLSPEMIAKLPKADNPSVLFTDVDWWAENQSRVAERFKEWLIRA